MLNAASTRNRSPFTATQRQELENQALIFKYMVAGVPIPSELLYSVKRSLESSMSTSGLFPHYHQPVGWGCFQLGFGRKADPEPGRCRRTDGKKWRCSKEAYPDSKYCERHMHRGRNRSRKPVELASSATTAATAITNNSTSSIDIINTNSTTNSLSSSSYTFPPHPHQNPSHNTYLNPFLYAHSSSSNKPPGCAVTPQNSTTSSLFSDPGSSLHPDNDYRYIHGMRSLDERALFPETSGSVRSLQNPYQELTMTSYKGYSELGLRSFADSTEHHQEQQQQHCFVLGTDFKSSGATTRPIKLVKEGETQKPLHHFFGEWQPKNTDSCLDLASNSRPAQWYNDLIIFHLSLSLSVLSFSFHVLPPILFCFYTFFFVVLQIVQSLEASDMDVCVMAKRVLSWWVSTKPQAQRCLKSGSIM